MNCVFYYGKKPDSHAGSVWTHDVNVALVLAHALKKDGWKVVWTVHSNNPQRPMHPFDGYEDALRELQEARERE